MAKRKKIYVKDFSSSIPLTNKKFQKILQFYLFECPVAGVSVKGVDFDAYGIRKKGFEKLKKKMFCKATPSFRNNYKACTSNRELSAYLEKCKNLSPPDEYCVFFKNKGTVMESLYYSIRNAFAHGGFCIMQYSKERIYILQNNHNDTIKAEMALHEETLLSWIGCVRDFNKPKQEQEATEEETNSESIENIGIEE